jgi:hypothetical protein
MLQGRSPSTGGRLAARFVRCDIVPVETGANNFRGVWSLARMRGIVKRR